MSIDIATHSIDGVRVRPLRQIRDDRGKIMHMLRRDDPHFEEFGEVYFSMVLPGVVKGWHLHRQMTLNYAVVTGTIGLALYDERLGSPTRGVCQEVLVGQESYALVTVPPGVWNGFKGIAYEPSIVANCATLPHDPDEIVRVDPFDNHIPYDWARWE
jgi:dTDP-4-dehydrorhamnose 3,5-epimerase